MRERKHDSRRYLYMMSIIHGIIKDINEVLKEDHELHGSLLWGVDYSYNLVLNFKEQGDRFTNEAWMKECRDQWVRFSRKHGYPPNTFAKIYLGQSLVDLLMYHPLLEEELEPLEELFFTLESYLDPKGQNIEEMEVTAKVVDQLKYITNWKSPRKHRTGREPKEK